MRFAVAVMIAACGGRTTDGLPPATDWSADDPTTIAPPREPGIKQPNSHEGVPGAPDIADDTDPHRGVPGAPPLTGGDVVEESPAHIDVTPAQPIDPATRVRGTIKLARSVANRVKPDSIIYLMAKTPDASGKPTGTAMAVDRLLWKADGQAFELGGATGEVLVIARYDQDGEGTSAQSGDVIGMTRVKVPADNVVIELSSVVE
jgi:hypothetical protein